MVTRKNCLAAEIFTNSEFSWPDSRRFLVEEYSTNVGEESSRTAFSCYRSDDPIKSRTNTGEANVEYVKPHSLSERNASGYMRVRKLVRSYPHLLFPDAGLSPALWGASCPSRPLRTTRFRGSRNRRCDYQFRVITWFGGRAICNGVLFTFFCGKLWKSPQ